MEDTHVARTSVSRACTWRIAAIVPERHRLVLYLEPMRLAVACPICGTQSRRVHSRYRRKPWDVPWGFWPVPLAIQARRRGVTYVTL